MKGLIKSMNDTEGGREVYIIRHGQTILNKEDKIRAWLDIPLTEEGVTEAEKLGRAMRRDKIEMDGLVTSDLLRSEQTSLEISRETGIPVLGTTRCLRPWDVGSFSGKDGKTVHKMMSEKARFEPDEVIGGGESFNIFKYRVLMGIIGYLNCHRGLKIGFVSHSRGERLLHGWAAADYNPSLDIDLDVFLSKGEDTATAQRFFIECPLVLS